MATANYRLSLLTFSSAGDLVFTPDALLAVDDSGHILSAGAAPRRLPRKTLDWRGRLAIPGLIDGHCHLSQYPAVAADGLELLPWLRENIFPLERKFRGEASRKPARRFFSELAAHGTTCAAIYTSIWADSTQVCFEEALLSGMRVIMGKVMMDRNSYDLKFSSENPGRRRAAVSLSQSEALCRLWHRREGGRILYAFTPRFALSCSPALMKAAAELSRRYGAYLQTHLSENRAEVEQVRHVFPTAAHYTGVYDRAGMLGPRTILAHCIWLKESEYKLLERSGSAVAHCPTSNAFLRSGVMDLGRMEKGNIPVALGSDVAAGPSLCLFSVMRQAIFSQRSALAHGVFTADRPLTAAGAFYLATLGGAKALGLEDEIGSLEPGKKADFVVLDPALYAAVPEARIPSAQSAVSQMVYRAERRAVAATFVDGRRVF